jgi:hypothetical protein
MSSDDEAAWSRCRSSDDRVGADRVGGRSRCRCSDGGAGAGGTRRDAGHGVERDGAGAAQPRWRRPRQVDPAMEAPSAVACV